MRDLKKNNINIFIMAKTKRAKTKRRKYKKKGGTLTKQEAATRRLQSYQNLPEDLQYEINRKYNEARILEPQSNELLHEGASKNNLEKVKYALNNYADIESSDIIGGNSALHNASYMGNLEIVRHLIRMGANINAESNNNRFTPLHWASLFGKQNVVEFLINAGATIEPRDHKNKTPLDYANEEGHEQIVELLVNAGATPPPPIDEALKAQQKQAMREKIRAYRESRGIKRPS